MTQASSNSTTPAFVAYAVRGDGDNAIWNRIGAAWTHRDGKGMSIALSAHPVGGRVVLRAPRDAENGDA